MRVKGDLRLTPTMPVSICTRTESTESAMESFIMLPSHDRQTSPVAETSTVTLSITRSRVVSSESAFVGVLPLVVPLVVLEDGESCLMLPNIPSKPHRIRSIPAEQKSRFLKLMLVVVRPAYSFRSSGAISVKLKPFCTSTPDMIRESSVLNWSLSSSELPRSLRGGI